MQAQAQLLHALHGAVPPRSASPKACSPVAPGAHALYHFSQGSQGSKASTLGCCHSCSPQPAAAAGGPPAEGPVWGAAVG